MSALTDLQAFGKACGNLDRLAELAAKRAAPLVEAQSKRTAAAGTDPDGKPWPAKQDGGRPLVNAADHVSARALDANVVIELVGPEVWHEMGAQGKPVRRVIPDVEPSEALLEAVDKGASMAFDEIMGGG
jgi:hypothetical protein